MKVLLIIPSFNKIIYENTKIRAGRIDSPTLAMPVIAANLVKHCHEVKILDLNLYADYAVLEKAVHDFRPEYAGISFVTPLYNEMKKISKTIKEINQDIEVVIGGPHVSSSPEESLRDSAADVAVVGEGDFTILEIVGKKDYSAIKGIAYKKNASVIVNPARELIKDLDILPFPAWHLCDLKRYSTSKLMAKKSPAGWIETSRGCPFKCSYCNKSVFGSTFRVKSPKRVVDEIEYMLACGFKEIHIVDDMFTTNVKRVKSICDEILARKLKFPWATVTGIRVDRGDQEMFDKLKQAGCYRVYVGVESGNQDILDLIGKNITIKQIKDTIAMIGKAKLEICGFFMLALPGDTEKTMQDTIDMACDLDLDFAKATITTPLPQTKLFEDLKKGNRIKTMDWSKYNLYLPVNELYDHPNLDWKTIEKYFDKFYWRFYFRPSYIIKTFFRAIKRGALLHYAVYFFRTNW